MPRILNFQKMEASPVEILGELGTMTEASSCSAAGCATCSSYSDSGCHPTQIIVTL